MFKRISYMIWFFSSEFSCIFLSSHKQIFIAPPQSISISSPAQRSMSWAGHRGVCCLAGVVSEAFGDHYSGKSLSDKVLSVF